MVTLAKPIDAKKRPKIGGWLVSEKLDGTRCFWDGGLTRGMRTIDVPWAGILHPKTLKMKDKIKPISTGLWSRYGNPIIAPDWYLDELPPIMLDGELWAGRGKFQLCRSIISGDLADSRWGEVEYKVYGTPSLQTMTEPGLIKNSNQYTEITEFALEDMLIRMEEMETTLAWATPETTFEDSLTELADMLNGASHCSVHLQRYLPKDEVAAWTQADKYMDEVLLAGGEGIIIRDPKALYETKRTSSLRKYKPVKDDEGTLVGFIAGKHAGTIGSLLLDYQGKRLAVSGLTGAERELEHYLDSEHGKEMLPGTVAKHFKLGQRITFRYRELTDAGIPKEASYMRVRDDE
jgi:DNA ligase-1